MLATQTTQKRRSSVALDPKTEAILRESEARFQKLFEEIPNIPVQGYDRHRRVIFWNQASEKVYGYSAAEAMGQRIEDLIIPPALKDLIVSLIDNWISGGDSIPPGELNLLHKDGREVPVFSSHVVLENTQGQREMYCVDLDLTESKQAQQDLLASEEKYRSIFENITQGLFQLSPEGRYLNINPFFVDLLGYDSADSLIEELTDLEQIYVDPECYRQLRSTLDRLDGVKNFESQVYRKDGRKIWISETWHTVRDDQGGIRYYEGRLEDISLRRKAVAQLRHDAIHDRLTGLFNRAYLEQELQKSIDAQRCGEIELYGLLFIDLNRFKLINDSLGHLVGDRVLKIVAERFRHSLRQDDVLARFGGDEFVVLLRSIAQPDDGRRIAQRLVEALEPPIQVDHEIFRIGASVGITLGNSNYSSASEVLRDADIAMYRAKASGSEQFVLFEQEMHPHALARLQLESELEQAIRDQTLELYYQPVMDLKRHRLSGFEALLRWQHPRRGWISPAVFVPIAEEAKLIEPLSWWVFETAIAQLQQWRSQLPQAHGLSMNVNLSVAHLKQTELAQSMQALLQKWELPSDRLKIEVTETHFLEASDTNMQVFQDLKSVGLGICIDDFGTGYSSLSRLHQLPLDVLKIDRAFVDGLEWDARKRAIAQSIVGLAHGLGADVVAEGVETEAQRDLLREMGCDYGQGYWFSRPVPGEAAAAMIQQLSP